MLLRLFSKRTLTTSSIIKQQIRTKMSDSYVSVSATGVSTSGNEEIKSLWNQSRTNDKAGETRTFFKDGKVTVAVSTGKDEVAAGKGEKYENKLKELSRKK